MPNNALTSLTVKLEPTCNTLNCIVSVAGLYENRIGSYKWLLQTVQGIKDIKIAQKESFFEDKYYVSGTLQQDVIDGSGKSIIAYYICQWLDNHF